MPKKLEARGGTGLGHDPISPSGNRSCPRPELAEAARQLLADKKVGLVVGYVQGTTGRARPAFIRSATDADKLIFDATCGMSLVPHLRKALRNTDEHGRARTGKVAVVAKGCDGRALVQHMVEGQLKRDDVVIIGVACEGVNDPKNRGKESALSSACQRCRYPSPPVYDILVGPVGQVGPVRPDSAPDEFSEVAEFEKLGADERWQWFEAQFAKCIRCYACRNACPMCYCDSCFVDQTSPLWLGKSAEQPDTMLFHIVRALHTAGRCVDCGACERACPLGVRLDLLNKRIEKEVRDRFGYTAGLSLEAKPAMATYSEEDKQEFIL